MDESMGNFTLVIIYSILFFFGFVLIAATARKIEIFLGEKSNWLLGAWYIFATTIALYLTCGIE